jgi:hypothetical protein
VEDIVLETFCKVKTQDFNRAILTHVHYFFLKVLLLKNYFIVRVLYSVVVIVLQLSDSSPALGLCFMLSFPLLFHLFIFLFLFICSLSCASLLSFEILFV